jgi:hypothetical protein
MTFDDLSAFPVQYRKAAYGTLTPDRKAELWREQFSRFESVDQTLTDAQKRLLKRVRAVLQPALFEPAQAEESRAIVKSLCNEASQILSQAQRRAFADLGEFGRPSYLAKLSASRIGVIERTAQWSEKWLSVRAGDALAPSTICECAIDSMCSCGTCNNNGADLCVPIYSPSNCGCLWMFQCDGNCAT